MVVFVFLSALGFFFSLVVRIWPFAMVVSPPCVPALDSAASTVGLASVGTNMCMRLPAAMATASSRARARLPGEAFRSCALACPDPGAANQQSSSFRRLGGLRNGRMTSLCRRILRGGEAIAVLQRTPVEWRELEAGEIDVVEAAHIDGDALDAIRAGPAGERFDPTDPTEQMVDDMLVESIHGQVVVAGRERKLRRPHERPQNAVAAADRAVAGDHRGEIGGHLIADSTAVAAAVIGCWCRQMG